MSARNDQQGPRDAPSRKERRAAERTARKKGAVVSSSGRRAPGPSMLVITVAAIIIGVVAVGALIALSGGFGGTEAAAVSRPDEPAPAQELRVGRSLGDPEAPVTIEAYEDPQCPACGAFTARIEPLLIAGPVSDGTVFYTFRDFPFLGQESLDAAVALRVAEDLDGRFWDYHQLVYHNQDGENQGAFSRPRLADMAELAGLDREAFLAAIDEPEYLAAVEAEYDTGVQLGVNSTPTLVINGELMRGVPDWDELRSRIETAAADGAATDDTPAEPAATDDAAIDDTSAGPAATEPAATDDTSADG